MSSRRLSPPQVLVISFALVIALGSWALHQPWAAVPGKQLRVVEAVFTATSATCVTGLVVRPPEDHTIAGQLVIISLIQVGGLGIMTFGLFFLLLVGRRLNMFGRDIVMSSLAQEPWEDFWPLLRGVIMATAAIEGAGALLCAIGWWGEKGVTALAWGAFHSVSAFCNAGFGLHAANLIPWRANPWVAITLGLLIICGGLGFLPITELVRKRFGRVRSPFSLHTRLALSVTAALLVLGWVGFATLEWHTTLKGLPLGERLLAIWFQGITPRTAGFATLDYGAMTPATLFFTMILMFIGASPGSTGGGVKTTTIGVLLAVIIARIRSRRQVTSFKRGVGDVSVLNAVVVLILGALVVVAGMVLVPLFEHDVSGGPLSRSRFLAQAFDVVSAFGTVGLSTGITPELNDASWWWLSLTMFVGRVGPLTLGMALGGRRPRPEPKFVAEEVMVG